MANLKDAETLIVGVVVDVAKVEKRDEPGTTDHYKVTIMVPNGGGFAVVKITTLDTAVHHGVLDVKPGQSTVAWYIRNAAYSIEQNSGMSTRLVRVASSADLDALAVTLGKAPAKAAA